MISRNSSKASAIVLRCLDYGEADRIVTFYTDNFGKLKGIAKGARRSKKRFPNALELFSCSNIIFSRRNREGLALIEGCDVTGYYPGIRSDIERVLVASYFIDLVDQFTMEGKKSRSLFQLLQDFLGIIDTGNSSETIMRLFELRLLKLTGFEPILDRCTICGRLVDALEANCDIPMVFNPAGGGVRCPKCSFNNRDSSPVSLGTIKTLLMGKDMEIARIHRLALSEQAAVESREILIRFIRHILGKELKSLDILNKIKGMEI